MVVGGGPCGLTAGAMLHRAGFEPTVYDRSPGPESTAVGVVVDTAGLGVLAHLGLAETVADAGQPVERARVLDADGRTLAWLDFGAFEGETFGHTPVSVDRRDLLEALRSKLPTDAVEYGRECTGVGHQSGNEQARFDDGEAVATSMVVGADGRRSSVRTSMFPEVSLRASGWHAHRGLATERFADHLRPTAWQVWGPGTRVGFAALGPERVGWTVVIDGPVAPDGEPARVLDALRDRCLEWPEPVPTLFARTDPETVTGGGLVDIAPLDRWSGDGIVLVGDAAHPALPGLWRGVGSALGDAHVLAERLRGVDSVEGALAAYQADRKPTADWTTRRSRQLLRLATVRRPTIRRLRNEAMRVVPGSVSRRWRRRLASVG